MVDPYEVCVVLEHLYGLFVEFHTIYSMNQHDPLCIHVLLATVLIAQDSY